MINIIENMQRIIETEADIAEGCAHLARIEPRFAAAMACTGAPPLRRRPGGFAALLKARRVTKVICSFPRTANSTVFRELYHCGFTELELVPQGTLAERIRAGGAGVPAFYTPSAVGTPLGEHKEHREFNGRQCVLEHGLCADFALIKANTADTHGNLLYNKTARNFSPIMAMAGETTIVQCERIVEPGGVDPEAVVTPGIFVDWVVQVPHPAHESELVAAGATYP